ncbi:MAG: hypothetical protein U9R75_09840 [Candidatus Thermoplasmatota archaeon]|nr:hypothetical protein [Candidatus Thermoplasmatota archaeon]MEA3559541.1 hypothetical protein [Candidatus Thermoplasmatota archaeon]
MEPNTIWLIIIIAAIVAVLLILISIITYRVKKKRSMPSHVELYFGENFRKIMGEWDFVTRDRVKGFKKDINKRLSVAGSDIDILEKNRTKLDRRLGVLDREMTRLEGL